MKSNVERRCICWFAELRMRQSRYKMEKEAAGRIFGDCFSSDAVGDDLNELRGGTECLYRS